MTPEEEEEFEFEIEMELAMSEEPMILADKLKAQFPDHGEMIEKCLFGLVQESIHEMTAPPETEQSIKETSETVNRIVGDVMKKVKKIVESRKEENGNQTGS